MTPPAPDRRGHELDNEWYGWGSAFGLGLVVLCFGLALAAVIAAFSLL